MNTGKNTWDSETADFSTSKNEKEAPRTCVLQRLLGQLPVAADDRGELRLARQRREVALHIGEELAELRVEGLWQQ